MALKSNRWLFVYLLASLAGVSCQATSLQAPTEPPQHPSVGQQAVKFLLTQVVLDPTATVQKTGAPLPSDGAWSAGKEVTPACPEAETCVRVFYRVPGDDVSCEWVIALVGDGSSGAILEQNEDASRYLLRKVPLSQAAALVTTRKDPSYPPIAMAARVQGSVVVNVFVSSSGEVEKAYIVSGPEMLRSSAIAAAQGWVFKPLLAGTKSIRFETQLAFDYKTMGPSSSSRVTAKP
jgi:TonB family protein